MIPRAIKRLFHQASIGDQSYRFMFRLGRPTRSFHSTAKPPDWMCGTTISLPSPRSGYRGNRILTSERFEAVVRPEARMNVDAIKVHRLREMDVAAGNRIQRIIPQFLHFVGGRPLVGYYVDFDVRMVDKYLLGLIGIELPNKLIEVSKLYL